MEEFSWDAYDAHYEGVLDLAITAPKTAFIINAIAAMSNNEGVTNTADVIKLAEAATYLCRDSLVFLHQDDIDNLYQLIRVTAKLEMNAICYTEMETPLHFNETIH